MQIDANCKIIDKAVLSYAQSELWGLGRACIRRPALCQQKPSLQEKTGRLEHLIER